MPKVPHKAAMVGKGRRERIPLHTPAMIWTPRSFSDVAVFAAPAVFVLLWASGFIGAKLGLPYAEPMTFLTVRMGVVVLVLGLIILLTQPVWPTRAGVLHSAVVGLLVHGCYLGGVFVAI